MEFQSKVILSILFGVLQLYGAYKISDHIKLTTTKERNIVNKEIAIIIFSCTIYAFIYGCNIYDINLFYGGIILVLILQKYLWETNLLYPLTLAWEVCSIASILALWGLKKSHDNSVFTIEQYLCINIFTILCFLLCEYHQRKHPF